MKGGNTRNCYMNFPLKDGFGVVFTACKGKTMKEGAVTSSTSLVPNLGVNYPNCVMGPFDLGNSIRPESKNWHWKNRHKRRIN